MTADELMKCVSRLRPSGIFSVVVEYSGLPYLKWDQANTTKEPTQAEIEAVLTTVRAEIEAERLVEEAQVQARFNDIASNLPSWAEVSTAIDDVTTLAGAKVILKKLARVTYWLAKDGAT